MILEPEFKISGANASSYIQLIFSANKPHHHTFCSDQNESIQFALPMVCHVNTTSTGGLDINTETPLLIGIAFWLHLFRLKKQRSERNIGHVIYPSSDSCLVHGTETRYYMHWQHNAINHNTHFAYRAADFWNQRESKLQSIKWSDY